MRALLVDDDHDLARLLRDYLGSHDASVDHLEDGSLVLQRLETSAPPYDVVLLDVMLPGADGFEICRRIRERHDLPIIMLTARGEGSDRVSGLDLGADDYVPKPFNPRELLARMGAVVRRAGARRASEAGDAGRKVEVGGLVIDPAAHKVTLDGRDVPVTSFELRLLAVLAGRVGQTVSREELARGVTPKGGTYDPSVDRSLDVHISHLRQKLGDDAREPTRIRTVRGAGYVLVKPT